MATAVGDAGQLEQLVELDVLAVQVEFQKLHGVLGDREGADYPPGAAGNTTAQ